MPRCKRTTIAGAVLEQEYYTVAERTNIKKSAPKAKRFETPEERDEYNRKKSLKRLIRTINANFNHHSYYVTLTYNDKNLPEDFSEAEKDIINYTRRLQHVYPYAKILSVKGRGRNTGRIHFHLVIADVPKRIIIEKWTLGQITRIEHLRSHNLYKDDNGQMIDHGEDYTALATYLFNHWTEEQGKGKRWKQTKTIQKPQKSTPKLSAVNYTADKPPRAPKGYILVESKENPFYKGSYLYFKFVLIPPDTPKEKDKAYFSRRGAPFDSLVL